MAHGPLDTRLFEAIESIEGIKKPQEEAQRKDQVHHTIKSS
jgi:hypothetical protein